MAINKQSVVGDTRRVSRFKIPERSTSTSGLINKPRINPYFVLTSRGTTLILLPFAVSILLGNPLDRGSNHGADGWVAFPGLFFTFASHSTNHVVRRGPHQTLLRCHTSKGRTPPANNGPKDWIRPDPGRNRSNTRRQAWITQGLYIHRG